MNSTDVWLAIAALTAVTVVGRCVLLFAPRAWQPRGVLARGLGYSPLAAMSAIAAPEVFRYWLERPEFLQGIAAQAQWFAGGLVDPRWLSALALYLLLRFVGNEFVSLLVAGGLFWLLR